MLEPHPSWSLTPPGLVYGACGRAGPSKPGNTPGASCYNLRRVALARHYDRGPGLAHAG